MGVETAVQQHHVKKRMNNRTKKRLGFYALIVTLPLLQLCLFYIYVNFNSILLAFQEYSNNTQGLGYVINFAGFKNFAVAIEKIGNSGYMIKNSLIAFFWRTGVGLSLALIFSFYLTKKYYASGFYKVILYMPQIVSHVVFALLFRYIVTDVYPQVARMITGQENVLGLLDNLDTKYATVVFYNVWIGFGVNVILFTGAMSGINDSIVESAQMDGVNVIQEFFQITIPMIFPTLITFIVVGIAAIFTDQMQLYTMFGVHADELSTIGYFLYVETTTSDVISPSINTMNYSQLSALGLTLTLIVFPITMTIRKVLEKYGPSVN